MLTVPRYSCTFWMRLSSPPFTCWNKSSRIIHKTSRKREDMRSQRSFIKMHMFNLWSRTFKGDQLSGNEVRHSFAICIPSCVFIHPGRCLHHKSTTCREKSHLKLKNHNALLWKAQYWLSFAIHQSFPRKNTPLFLMIYLSAFSF